jgi:DNA uptake protein ComE-like DNA-binding protein
VVAILSLAAYQYADLMTGESRATDRILRSAEAKALSDSGIHYCAGVLATPDNITTILNNNPYDNPAAFQGIAVNEASNPARQGRFSIVGLDYNTLVAGDRLQLRYGVMDEAGRINLNALMQLDSSGKILHDILVKIPNMTEEIANAIIDWIDTDENVRSGGAESQTYASRTPPYRCKNGPLDSIEELLLVQGVTPELLFGSDTNRNGQLDADEAAMGGGAFDAGWAPYFTVYSRERNVDLTGAQRTNINSRDISTLSTKLPGLVGQDVSDFILGYRLFDIVTGTPPANARPGTADQLAQQVKQASGGIFTRPRRSVSSFFSLVNAQVQITIQNQVYLFRSPLLDVAKQREALPVLFDKCTTSNSLDLPGKININTAPRAVLATLPGLTDYVDLLLERRPAPNSAEAADEIYQSPAWLLTEAELRPETLQTIERYITSRTQVYRVQSIGYFDGPGPMVRTEAVIDTNGGKPRIIYYRDLTELGQVFRQELKGQ